MTRSDDTLGIYFHIPFCLSKCPYCDFYSHCDRKLIPEYVTALKKEMITLSGCGKYTDGDIKKRRVTSVYFGGGTPSLLGSGNTAELIGAVKDVFPVSPDAEITLECNPSLPDAEDFFAAVAGAGVNRVSLGLQSAVGSERKALGRLAGPDAVKYCVLSAKKAGITNISLDVMLGIPGQTPQTLKETLDFCMDLDITHLSVYMLKLEEGTLFYKRKDSLDLPDEDAAADMYLCVCGYLRERGMRHYEISNFCFGENLGRHNLRYWQDREYLGFGPSAHSFYKGNRFYYKNDISAFLSGEECLYEGVGGCADEFFMLALRTDTGVRLTEFEDRFGRGPGEGFFKKVKELEKPGYIEFDGDLLRLTDTGMLVSNAVIVSLLDYFI